VVQGEALSSLLFGALIHKPLDLQELHAAIEVHSGSAAAGVDDVRRGYPLVLAHQPRLLPPLSVLVSTLDIPLQVDTPPRGQLAAPP
jgi:hypothetical protein